MAEKLNILVLGSNGMLGHALVQRLKTDNLIDVYSLSRYASPLKNHFNCDLLNRSNLEKVIKKCSPDVIVNCAGILVKNSQKLVESAIEINSCLPNYLSQLTKKLGFRLIHISTDCVFNGEKGNYKESEIPNANDIYGKTKWLGEVTNNSNVLTIRTSIIGFEISKERTGLLEWIISMKGKSVSGYNNVLWNGLTTLELSNIILKKITRDPKTSGLIHAFGVAKVSKLEIIKVISTILDLNIEVVPDLNKISDKSLTTETDCAEVIPGTFRDRMKFFLIDHRGKNIDSN